jgi:hypothetical protein
VHLFRHHKFQIVESTVNYAEENIWKTIAILFELLNSSIDLSNPES